MVKIPRMIMYLMKIKMHLKLAISSRASKLPYFD